MSVVSGIIEELEEEKTMSVHKLKGLKGGGYQARWSDPAGVRRAKNFKTKAQAQRYEAEMSTAVRRGEYSDPQAGRAKPELALEADGWDLWDFSSGSNKPRPRNCTMGNQGAADPKRSGFFYNLITYLFSRKI